MGNQASNINDGNCLDCMESGIDPSITRHNCKECDLCDSNIPQCYEWCSNKKKRIYNRSKVDVIPNVYIEITDTHSCNGPGDNYYIYSIKNNEMNNYFKFKQNNNQSDYKIAHDHKRYKDVVDRNEIRTVLFKEYIQTIFLTNDYKIVSEIKPFPNDNTKWLATVQFIKKQE